MFFHFDIIKEIEINYFMNILSSTNEIVYDVKFTKISTK